LFFWNLLII